LRGSSHFPTALLAHSSARLGAPSVRIPIPDGLDQAFRNPAHAFLMLLQLDVSTQLRVLQLISEDKTIRKPEVVLKK
jgi:hypothetical protein